MDKGTFAEVRDHGREGIQSQGKQTKRERDMEVGERKRVQSDLDSCKKNRRAGKLG